MSTSAGTTGGGPEILRRRVLFCGGKPPRPTVRRMRFWPRAAKCTHALSPETAEFIGDMFESECRSTCSPRPARPRRLLHLSGGLPSAVHLLQLQRHADDVDVLTHEAGHAFAAWVAARKDLPTIVEEPGMESCEIHSMSMEFLRPIITNYSSARTRPGMSWPTPRTRSTSCHTAPWWTSSSTSCTPIRT